MWLTLRINTQEMLGISAPPEKSCMNTLSCLTWLRNNLIYTCFWALFQSSFPYAIKMSGQSMLQTQKKLRSNINHIIISYDHIIVPTSVLSESVSADLIIQIQFQITQGCSCFTLRPSVKGWLTKAKEALCWRATLYFLFIGLNPD